MSNSPASLRVFLCHSSEDKPKIRELYQQLEKDGFAPWLDKEDLLPGQDWDQEIARAVRRSHVVIICLSASSISKKGYVQKEIKYALDVADEQPEGTIFLIPLKLEECVLPDRLRRWHSVKLFEESGYDKLVSALRKRADSIKGPSAEITAKDVIDGVREFRAEPPFQLLWDESVLIDGRKRKILLPYDLHSVLKSLVYKEPGNHGLVKSQLTFTEIAASYKGDFEDFEEAQEIAHNFARNLRRFLGRYDVQRGSLIKSWKGYGYRIGDHWGNPPSLNASEASLLFTDDIEKTERLVLARKIARRAKLSTEY